MPTLPTLAVLERLFDRMTTPSVMRWTLSKCHNPGPLAYYRSLNSKANTGGVKRTSYDDEFLHTVRRLLMQGYRAY